MRAARTAAIERRARSRREVVPDARAGLNGASPIFRSRRRAPLALAPTSARDGVEKIRWSRVMTARARVAAGYYQRADVRELVAEAVLRELQQHP